MEINRRDLLQAAQGAAAALALGRGNAGGAEKPADDAASHAYPYRIAFGVWVGDMRNSPLPIQKWPAPELDEEAVASFIQAMDVQSQAGFNYLDAWGLFATYGYRPLCEG